MARALFFLLFLTILSLASLWFVENDGSIVVEWMGYRVQTSVAFAILFVIIAIITCTLLLQIILWVKSAPKRYKKALKERRLSRGLLALTQGFAAIHAEDKEQARALSRKASSNLDNMPLTKLLAAQTAQLDGNRELAKVHYTSMLENKETEIIAIKGLLIEAKHDSDLGKALFLAEKAFVLRPNADWVILILLDLYKKLRKWSGAEEMTRRALKHKLITNEIASRNIGLITFAKYQELPKIADNSSGESLIKTAYKLLPDFVPITVAYANMLVTNGKIRKAIKLLENQWSKSPHPDIAAAYMQIHADLPDEKRMEKAEKLLSLYPSDPEGHLLVAGIALALGQFGKARHHLKISLSFGETRDICNLMAELESLERAGYETIHAWRERALIANDFSIWQCLSCNNISHKWHITCNKCNAFDSVEWKYPQGNMSVSAKVNLLGAD